MSAETRGAARAPAGIPAARMEPLPTSRDELRRAIARGNWLHGAHLALCANFVLWRVIENTPALASSEGATWSSTPPGRGVAFVSALAAIGALVAVIVATLRTGQRVRAWLWFAALLAALGWRARIDVFDLVYVGASLVLATYWYREERPRLRERVRAAR